MTQPQAILFDMDGTIVDTEPLWEAAEARALADMGTKMTPDMRAQLLGSTLPRMVALLRSFAAHPLDEAVVGQRVEQGVIDLLDEGLPWKVGLRELLEWANSKGIPTAVVTATRRHVASRVLAHTPVTPGFTTAVYGDDVTEGKPSPEGYLKAARLLGADIASCLIVEDSPVGLQAAQASGGVPVAIKGAASEDFAKNYPYIRELTDLNEEVIGAIMAGECPNFVQEASS